MESQISSLSGGPNSFRAAFEPGFSTNLRTGSLVHTPTSESTKFASNALKTSEKSVKAKNAPVAKKAVKKVTGDKKRSKMRSTEVYKFYIFKVLKQVHPEVAISSKSLSILNSFVADIFEKIATETQTLACYDKSQQSVSKEIQTAVRLVLPG